MKSGSSWNHCSQHENEQDVRQRTTDRSSTVSYGFYVPVHRGVTCRSAMDLGGPYTAVSTVGRSKACGMLSLRPCKRNPMPLETWTGASTM
jgi:hypothetical protein